MNWKQLHWSDQALILSILAVVIQATQQIAGVTIVPLPSLVCVGAYLCCLVLVFLSQRGLNLKLPAEALIVCLLGPLFIAYGQLTSSRTYSQAETDLFLAVTAFLLLFGLIHLRQNGATSALETSLGVAFAILGLFNGGLGIMKLSIDSGGGRAGFVRDLNPYPSGTSLVADYNMSALATLLGVISFAFFASRQKDWKLKALLYSFSGLLAIVPLISNSRRYLIAFGALTILSAGALLWPVLTKSKTMSLIQTATRGAGALFLLGPAILLSLVVVGTIQKVPEVGVGSTFNESIARFRTLSQLNEALASSRGSHWDAGTEYLQRANPTIWLTGSGFDYMMHISDDTLEDHPHSPILSALLYGGVLACLALLVLLVRSGIIMLQHFASYPLFIACYVPCLMFLLVSGNAYSSTFLLAFLPALGYSLLVPGRNGSSQKSASTRDLSG